MKGLFHQRVQEAEGFWRKHKFKGYFAGSRAENAQRALVVFIFRQPGHYFSEKYFACPRVECVASCVPFVAFKKHAEATNRPMKINAKACMKIGDPIEMRLKESDFMGKKISRERGRSSFQHETRCYNPLFTNGVALATFNCAGER